MSRPSSRCNTISSSMLPAGVGSEHERPRRQRLVGEVGDEPGVVEGVFDLTVGDAVLAGGSMDLHITPQS